jgi:hypothetical protein
MSWSKPVVRSGVSPRAGEKCQISNFGLSNLTPAFDGKGQVHHDTEAAAMLMARFLLAGCIDLC